MGEQLLERCSGSDLTLQQWTNVWSDDRCYNTFYTRIYSDNGQIRFNEQGYRQIQNVMNSVFDKYVTELDFEFTIPGDAKYNSLQERFKDVCTRLPGICNSALATYCHSCTNCSTRQSIASNLGTLNFCGCYAPSPDIDIAEIPPECDPFCTRIESIPLPNGTGGRQICTDNLCVISDVTIRAAQTSGTINFDQVCNACKQECKCIISGIDISSTLSELGTTFNQSCGPNSICIQNNAEGVGQVVNCVSQEPNSESFLVIAGSIILVVVIFIIIIIIVRRKTKF